MGLFSKIKQTADDARNRVDTAKSQVTQAQQNMRNAVDAVAGKPIPLDEELKARYAEEDTRSIWINVSEDKWLNEHKLDHCTVEPVSAVFEGNTAKKDFVFLAPNGARLFRVTSRMNAYKDLSANTHRALQKLFILYYESELGNYYRIKVVFVK